MFRLLYTLSLPILLAASLTFPANAEAADYLIHFQSVTGKDIALVQQIFSSDDTLNDLVLRDYIHISSDVRIAKADLDDSGDDEILLLVKQTGEKPCTEHPCQLQIWKRTDPSWTKLGTYDMLEEPLRIYDEKDNGFHEIANSQGVIPWNDK